MDLSFSFCGGFDMPIFLLSILWLAPFITWQAAVEDMLAGKVKP
jgi:hypothetical protein